MEVYSVDFNYVILGKKDDFLNELREPYLAEKLVFTSILFFSSLSHTVITDVILYLRSRWRVLPIMIIYFMSGYFSYSTCHDSVSFSINHPLSQVPSRLKVALGL